MTGFPVSPLACVCVITSKKGFPVDETDPMRNTPDISTENTMTVVVFLLFTVALVSGIGWLMWLNSNLG